MKKVLGSLGVVFGGVLASGVAFAEGAEGASAGGGNGLVAIASALAIGLAAFGAASGQGKASAGALEGIARNPTSRDQVFMPLILCLAFMEFQALLGFLIAFMWYSK